MAYIIRTSDRKDFKACRQYWDFASKIRQDYEPVRVPKNLEFGTAIHAGLQTWYEAMKMQQGFPGEVQVGMAVAEFKASNRAMMLAHGDSPPAEIVDDYTEREELGIGMLKYYCNEYAPYNDNFTVLAVEHEFQVPVLMPKGWYGRLPEGFRFVGGKSNQWPQLYCWSDKAREFVPVLYQGTIDLIVIDEDGEVWIIDHKTRRALKEETFHLDVDTQVTSYAWAAQFFIDKPIAGVIFNELRKAYPQEPNLVYKGTKLSKDKSQPVTYDYYMRAIREHGFNEEDYEDFLEWLDENEPVFVRRHELHRSQAELDSQGRIIYDESLDMLGDPAIYPSPSEFNCNGCPFQAPCLATIEDSDPDYILSDPALYRKRSNA